MRRDGEIALRRVLRRSSFARNIKFIRRGVIYPARGRLPHRRVPGRTMCAPTRGARRGWVCGWPQGFPQPVGADSISARKLRATANRADIESALTIYPPKYLSPPKNQKRPPTHKTQKPKNQKSPPKNHNPRPPAVLPERPAGGVLMPGIPGHPRVYLKNPQHCLILLKSSVCCVTKPWNTSSIPAVPCLASATF